MLCQRLGRKACRSNLLFVGLTCLANRSSGIRGMRRMGFRRIYIIQYSGASNKQIPHKNSLVLKGSKGFFRKNPAFAHEKAPQKRRESHPAGFRGAFCFFKNQQNHLFSVFANSFQSSGLAICPFIPTVLAACTSSANAVSLSGSTRRTE